MSRVFLSKHHPFRKLFGTLRKSRLKNKQIAAYEWVFANRNVSKIRTWIFWLRTCFVSLGQNRKKKIQTNKQANQQTHTNKQTNKHIQTTGATVETWCPDLWFHNGKYRNCSFWIFSHSNIGFHLAREKTDIKTTNCCFFCLFFVISFDFGGAGKILSILDFCLLFLFLAHKKTTNSRRVCHQKDTRQWFQSQHMQRLLLTKLKKKWWCGFFCRILKQTNKPNNINTEQVHCRFFLGLFVGSIDAKTGWAFNTSSFETIHGEQSLWSHFEQYENSSWFEEMWCEFYNSQICSSKNKNTNSQQGSESSTWKTIMGQESLLVIPINPHAFGVLLMDQRFWGRQCEQLELGQSQFTSHSLKTFVWPRLNVH